MQTAISPTERRIGERYAIEGDRVVFSAVSGGEQRLVVARVVDLSHNGVLVQVPKRHIDRWPGLQAIVSPLVINFDGEHVIECEAEVVWLGGQQRGGVRNYRSGLCFTEMSDEDRQTLARYLDSLGAPRARA